MVAFRGGETLAADGSIVILIDGDDSKLKSTLGNLGKVASGAVKGVTAAIGGLTAALGAAAGYSIKVGAGFESSMSNVAAISGAAGAELEALTDKAKEMGAKTKFSAIESADALAYMAMAGWKTEDMLGGLEGIMNLAAASGEDLAATSDIVTDAMTAFGMQASESAHFADVLAAASSNSNTNVGLMGETFKYVAPVAGALGYSVEDTAAAIGLMANAGIKGSQAGTALRTLLTNLAKPTDQVAGYMEALGVSLTDASGQMLPLRELLGELRESFAQLSEAERAEYAAGLAGQEGMSGLLAIVSASDADFDKLTESIDGSSGAAEEMAAIMNDNLQGALKIVQSGLEGLGISVYEGLQAPLKEAAQSATGMIQQLQDAFNQGGLEGLVGALGSVAAQAVAGIAEQAPAFVDAAAQLLQSFIQGITDNAPQLIDAAGNILIALGEGILTTLPMLADSALTLLTSFAQYVMDNVPQMIPAAVETVAGLVENLTDNFDQLVDVAVEMLVVLGEGLIDALPTLIEKIPEIVINIADAINNNAPKLLTVALGLMAELAVGLVKNIPTIIKNLPKIIEAIVKAFLAFNWLKLGKQLMEGLAGGIRNAAQLVKNAAQNIVEAIKGGFKALPSKLLQIGKELVQGLGKGITNGAKWALDAIKNLGKQILSNIKGFFGIRSPSRVMRDQVGRMVARGMALGIEDGSGEVKQAVHDLSYLALENAKQDAGSYKELGSLYINNLTYGIEQGRDASVRAMEQAVQDDVDAYRRKTEQETETLVQAKKRQMEKASETEKEALQAEIDQLNKDSKARVAAYETAGKEATKVYKESLTQGYDDALAIIKERVTGITEEFQKAHDDLVNQQDSMQKKLAGFGDLFTIDSKTGNLALENIHQNIDAIHQYDEALRQLKERGASDDFMQQVANLGVEEGAKFAEKLNSLPAEAFEEYTTAWQEQQDLAKEVAEKFYTDQLETLDKEFAGKLDRALEDVPTLLADLGVNSMQGMIDGMNSKAGPLSDAASAIVRRAIEAMKQEADINSPSKVTRDEVGKQLAAGIGIGTQDEMDAVNRRMREAVASSVVQMSAAAAAQANSLPAQIAQPPAPAGGTQKQPVVIEMHMDATMSQFARASEPYLDRQSTLSGVKLVKIGGR